MTSEIKVGMLSAQGCTDGRSPFKMIAACQQATNEVADDYNSAILHSVDDIKISSVSLWYLMDFL